MTTPIVPKVATNANASGTPAKLAATPEKEVTAARTTCGSGPHDRGREGRRRRRLRAP